MRKKIMLLIVVLVVLSGIGYYISLPDYLVWNSYSQSNSASGTRDTKLSVIVYQYWDYDELIDDIVDEFNGINDDPASTSIEVNLYYSKCHMRNSEPFRTEQFAYENKIKK